MKAIVPLRDDLFFPLEQTFEKFYRDFFGDKSNINIAKSSSGYPKTNVYIDGEQFKMLFSVPGVSKEELEIEVDGDTVTVKGKMSSKYCSAKDSEYLVRELRQSFFTRTLSIPNGVVGEPEANLADGILTLTWETERAKEPPVKRIEIK